MNQVTNLDAPETTAARRAVILKKPFLKGFYDSFYTFIKGYYSGGFWIELGSGAGYIKSVIPGIKTSDYLELPDQDLQVDALNMPFESESVDGICMLDVLHHLQDPGRFFEEALRVLKPGGKIVMQEPANTAFGRFIYRNFHHELFEPAETTWKLPPGGPLSMGNGAIPWIIFVRDRKIFETRFPQLKIQYFEGVHPFLYLFSGGFTAPQLLPSFLLPAILFIDRIFGKWSAWPMFMRVVVTKKP